MRHLLLLGLIALSLARPARADEPSRFSSLPGVREVPPDPGPTPPGAPPAPVADLATRPLPAPLSLPGGPRLLPYAWQLGGAPSGAPPASQPSTQPASQPTSQPSSQPSIPAGESFRARPINLGLYRRKTYPDGTESKSVGLVYWHSIGKESGWRLLAPAFFHYWKTPSKQDLWLYPIGFSYRDETSARALVGPVYHKEEGSYRRTVVFPLYWRTQDEPAGIDYLTAGPYYRYLSPNRRSAGLAPFVFSSRVGDERSLAVFPFFYREASPDESLLVTPLGFYSWERGRKGRGLIGPLYLARDGDTRTATLPPLFVHRATGRAASARSWTLTPLSFSSTQATRAPDGSLGERRLVATPLGFAYRSDAAETRSLLLLNTFYRRHQETTAVGVLPFWYQRTSPDSQLRAAPLFLRWRWGHPDDPAAQQGTFTYALAGWRYRSGETTATGLLSAYYKTEPGYSSAGLLPLAWYKRRVTPVADEAGGVFLARDTRITLLPLFHANLKREPDWSHTRLYLGPLYLKRNPETKVAGLFPLVRLYRDQHTVSFVDEFGRKASRQSFHQSLMLTPLVFASYHSDRERYLGWLGPFYYRSRPNQTALGAFPVVHAGHSGAPGDTNYRRWFYALPFYWHQGPEIDTAGLFPLAWYRNEHPFTGRDRKTGAILPLFYARKTATGSLFASLPYGRVTRQDAGQTTRTASWLGPAIWADSQEAQLRALLPLYWDRLDRTTDTRTTMLLPLTYQKRGPGFAREMFFWLYWHQHDELPSGERLYESTTLLPLYFHRAKPQSQQSFTLLGPLYRRQRFGEARSGLFPLAWYNVNTRPGDESLRWGLFPLLSYRHDSFYQRLVTPLGFYQRDVTDGESRGLFLSAAFWDNEEAKGSLVFPFYLHRTDKRDGGETLLSPLWMRYRRPVTVDGVASPGAVSSFGWIFWRGQHLTAGLDDAPGRRFTALLPLFYRRADPESALTLALPLFGRAVSPTRRLTVAPLVYLDRRPQEQRSFSLVGPAFVSTDAEGYRAGLLPLAYWGKEGTRAHQVLFPVFWRSTDSATGSARTVLGPLYQTTRPGYQGRGLFPLVHQHRRQTSTGEEFRAQVLPLFWYQQRGPAHTLITPLGFSHQTQDRSTRMLLTGLAWDNPIHQGQAILPFYIHQRSKVDQSEAWMAPPFFGRYQQPVAMPGVPQRFETGRVSVYGGLLWTGHHLTTSLREVPGRHFTTLFPLFFSTRDELAGTRAVTAGPLFWRSRPNQYEAGLFPLLWVGRSQTTAQDGGQTVRLSDRRHQLLFPLFLHTRDVVNDRHFLSVAGVLWWRRTPYERALGAFPVARFFSEEVSGGRARRGYLFPLVSYDSSPTHYRITSIPLSLYKDEDRRGGRFLLGLWERGQDSLRVAGLPLFWYERQGEVRTTSVLLPLPYYRKVRDENRGAMGIFPLFYASKDNDQRSLLTPLAYYAKDKDSLTLYAIPGLYARRRGDTLKAGLWPIARAEWKGEGLAREGYTYAFPFFLYRAGFTTRSLITPLAAYQENGGRRSLWALLYYRSRTDEGGKTDLVFPFYYRSRTPARSLGFLAPFYVGYRREGLSIQYGLPLLLGVKTPTTTVHLLTPLALHTKTPKAERWRFALLWSFTRYNKDYYLSRGIPESELTAWELRLPPVFKFTRDNATSFQWKALGLFGFERNGNARRLFLFGVPLKLQEKPPRQRPPASPS